MARFAPRYTLTPRILRQLKAIERTTGFLEAVRLRPEWIAEVRSKTNVKEALASLQIEGSSLTLERAFELAAEKDLARELRDSEREFTNYLRAFEAVDSLRGERDAALGAGDLRNLHRLLVEGVRGGRRGAGTFRREDVVVGDTGGGEEVVVHHRPPAWHAVESEVEALFAWLEASKTKGRDESDPWVHPVIGAGIAQHRLVWIHPFVDGNGRSARMLTTLLLYQRGYDFKYLFELSSYYGRDSAAYYAALRTADRSGDYTDWLTYFLGGFSWQMVGIQEAVRRAAA